ncbi:hypothetical protein Glove_313g31 [Diversispora epigaea]|uniref:BTB domain-containing protein n=1 Tax=Diversispora epigaea TaxID=1348612 RepID=A0A397HR31_9GLOM|nr:hypothetical protein Glove_313g31 [Diversispora epigaea]
MKTQFYDRLSNDLTQLLENGINYDVSIEVGEEDTNIYKVHSIILQSRSPYFKKFFDEITFNDDHVKVLNLPNISVKVFDIIIKYIYGGTFSLEKLGNSVIFDLLIASNELELDELVEYLQTHLINNCASWLRLKFAQIYRTSYQVKILEIIQDFCNNIIVKHPNTIFEYIYGGTFSLEKLGNSVIFDLLIASNELELDELVEYLQTHLINNCASWLRLKFAQIYRTSYQVKNLEIIQDFCNNIIVKHPNTIFESEIFHSLPEDALISILKRDDLQLEEVKIWEYLIQWGKAKSPMLPTNLNEWTSDNFLTLKETLKQCLQHIRYFSISGEDVTEKIYPYLQLLEHQLFLDINAKLITPTKPISSIVLPPRRILNTKLPIRNTPILLSSSIITNEQALEISSWIDKKETPYIENYPYDFELLVRGSRDGFDVKTIYNICDKVFETVIILKVECTGEILGGFNPLEWDNNQNQRKRTEDSFVFSLKTENMENSILSRVKRFDYAIVNYPKYSSLRFGKALCLKGNLKTEKKCCCVHSVRYPKAIRSDEFISPKVVKLSDIASEFLFSVEEYEVFKISPRNDLN